MRTPVWLVATVGMLLLATFPNVVLGVESFFFRDYGVLAYPTVAYARDAWLRGELPLWNPLSHCGVPFLAQWGTMVLYPFSFLYVLLPLPWSLSVFCLGHVALGGAGMFLLARAWTQSSFGAFVAGVGYALSGTMLASLVWPNYLVALGWMPWVVWLVERAWRERGRWIAWATLASALQLLAGVPEIVVLTWAVAGAVFLGSGAVAGLRTRITKATVLAGTKATLALLAVVVLAAGICAAQLLPFFELLEQSHRQATQGPGPIKWAMPLWGFGNLVAPLFHCFKTPQGNFFQPGQEFLSSYYPGIAVLAFALIGAVWSGRRRAWLVAGLAILGFVLALGPAGVVYEWVRSVVPGVGLARYPVKFVYLSAFAIPLLAAFCFCADRPGHRLAKLPPWSRWLGGWAVVVGLLGFVLWSAERWPMQYDRLAETVANGKVRAVFLTAVLAVAAVAQSYPTGRRRIGLQTGVLFLLAADTLTHSPNQNPALPADAFAPLTNPATTMPKSGEGRLLISPAAERALLRSTVTNWLADFTGKRLAYWSNLNLIDGVPKVNGASTLQLRHQAAVQSLIYTPPDRDLKGLLDFLGVTVMTKPGEVLEWVRRDSAMPLVSGGQRPFYLDDTNSVNVWTNASFDPRRFVLISNDDDRYVSSTNQVKVTIREARVTTHRIEVDVESEAKSVLVVAQSHHPNWQATVNNAPVRLLRANHAFQAVTIPQGRSRVVIVYRDRVFEFGAVISLISVLVCGVWLWRTRRTAGKAVNPGN